LLQQEEIKAGEAAKPAAANPEEMTKFLRFMHELVLDGCWILDAGYWI